MLNQQLVGPLQERHEATKINIKGKTFEIKLWEYYKKQIQKEIQYNI